MPLNINTNLSSLSAQSNLGKSQSSLTTSMERLSSGLRINSAKDDAAGLAISDRMSSQINGMKVAMRNTNDGVSLAQVAEGAISEVGGMLQRMRDLAVQSRNGANSGSDKDALSNEFKQMQSEVLRVFGAATFNGQAILSTNAGAKDFQVGANTTTNDLITVTTTNMVTDASITAVTAGTVLIDSTANTAALKTVIDDIDLALTKVNEERSKLGATQNRFASVIANLDTSILNQSAARSRITDADFGTETSNLSRAQILQQAGTAMLAQANQSSQGVLSLLR